MSYEAWDRSGDKDITCPYCGKELDDAWEIYGDMHDDQTALIECDNEICEKPYWVQVHIQMTFSTNKIEKNRNY